MLFGQRFDVVVVDLLGVLGHAVVHCVEPFATERHLEPVGEVPTVVQ